MFQTPQSATTTPSYPSQHCSPTLTPPKASESAQSPSSPSLSFFTSQKYSTRDYTRHSLSDSEAPYTSPRRSIYRTILDPVLDKQILDLMIKEPPPPHYPFLNIDSLQYFNSDVVDWILQPTFAPDGSLLDQPPNVLSSSLTPSDTTTMHSSFQKRKLHSQCSHAQKHHYHQQSHQMQFISNHLSNPYQQQCQQSSSSSSNRISIPVSTLVQNSVLSPPWRMLVVAKNLMDDTSTFSFLHNLYSTSTHSRLSRRQIISHSNNQPQYTTSYAPRAEISSRSLPQNVTDAPSPNSIDVYHDFRYINHSLILSNVAFPPDTPSHSSSSTSASVNNNISILTTSTQTFCSHNDQCDCKQHPESLGYARALLDIKKGKLQLCVPHLCIPWGKKLGELLYKQFGIQLERRSTKKRYEGIGNCSNLFYTPPTSSCVPDMSLEKSDPKNSFNWMDFVSTDSQIYATLTQAELDYNDAMLLEIENRIGSHTLKKAATLIKLAYINEYSTSLNRTISNILEKLESIAKDMKNIQVEPFHDHSPIKSIIQKLDLLPTFSSVSGSSISQITIQPINAGVKPLEGSTDRYLILGAVVEREWLEEFISIVRIKLGIEALPVAQCVISRVPTQAALNQYLQHLFHPLLSHLPQNTNLWLKAFPALKAKAKWLSLCRQQRYYVSVRSAFSHIYDKHQKIRMCLLQNAVQCEAIDRPLAEICALRVAESIMKKEDFAESFCENMEYIPESINALELDLEDLAIDIAWNSVPKEVWRMIQNAKGRLSELEDINFYSLKMLYCKIC